MATVTETVWNGDQVNAHFFRLNLDRIHNLKLMTQSFIGADCSFLWIYRRSCSIDLLL